MRSIFLHNIKSILVPADASAEKQSKKRRTRAKLLWMGIFMIGMATGGTGCMGKTDTVSVILREMEDKYGEEFTFETVSDGQIGSPYLAIITRCKSYPEAEIMAQVYWDEDGKRILTDNYLSYYLQEEVQAQVAAVVEQVYGESKVFYIPMSQVLPPEYTKEMNAEEFLSQYDSGVNVFIYLPPEAGHEEKVTEAEFLQKEFTEKGYALKGLICYTKQAEFYQAISMTSAQIAYTETEYVADTGLFLQDPAKKEFVYLRWLAAD